MMDSTLANRLQIWGFEEGVTVFKDFSLGAGFKLSVLDITCQPDDTINRLKTQIGQFLNGLPSGLSIQFCQEIVPGNLDVIKRHESIALDQLQDLTARIIEQRVEKFAALDASGTLPKQNLFVFVRRPFEQAVESQSRLQFFKKRTGLLKEDHLGREILAFERVIENLLSGLSLIGVEAKRLNENEVFQLLYRQWNPGRQVDAQPMSTNDIRDQVVLTDAVLGLDHFLLGRTYHKVISLKLLPEQTYSSMVETLRSLPFDSRLYLSVEVQDQQKEISTLQLQRRMAYASVVGKKGVSDLESQAKLRDIEAILEEMIQGVERVFKFSLSVLLRSEDPNELESQVGETLQRIREMNGAEGMLETVAAFDIFTEFALPNTVAKERAIKVNTSVLADFIPLYGNWKGHEIPRVLLRTRDGGLLPFDPFSGELTNSNMIVSGGSGSGKSYFANSLISQMLKESPKVFILDIGASYRRICENLNGQYIELGIKSDMAINPFSMDGIDPDDTESVDRKLKFLVALVEIMTKEQGRLGLGKLERSEVETCIKDILGAELNREPRLSDLKEKLIGHPDTEIKRLGRILSLWCGNSPFGKFVDRPTTVSLNRDVVCFDLKGLDSHPDLQSVCLFLITDLIWREVQKDRTQMKFTIFDECWRLLQDESASLFIGDVFRTFRKYRASAIAISQTMDDFSKSAVAGAIMPNSSIKWLLKQKGADQDSLKNALQLNDREMALVSSLQSEKGRFSEAFLMAEDKRQVVRIESTPLEYWLFTTDPTDLGMLSKMRGQHPDLPDLEILKLCAETYPEGAALGTRKEGAG